MAAVRGPAPWRSGWLPALQLVRRGSKAVTRHWKAMHFQRQKLMAVTEYVPPRPAVPTRCLPPARKEEKEEEYGYARLLRHQVEEAFRDNRMIAVCQYNSMPGEDVVLMRHYLRKHNIEVKFVLNEVWGGACIDDTILSRQGVENFAKLPSLEASQGQTVGTLALLPSQTCSLLQRGVAHLTALLDGHIQQLQAGAGETGSPEGTDPAQSSGTQ
ncbi:hypothetical protein ASZ78_008931 [Callipepla squamata]|uniref:Large ribosomal subunit protein uL10m n=1 Tax=Callipepla squamata TaxID=9009 RepID=A0A226N7N0_CALSU|nr:hypothetical protein ASZ78_008931 [Callipepla squamata]